MPGCQNEKAEWIIFPVKIQSLEHHIQVFHYKKICFEGIAYEFISICIWNIRIS